jgi:succinyl-CoA synthetase beta subunit
VGGVFLNLDTAIKVEAGAAALSNAVRKAAPAAALTGFLVQEMVSGVELIVGARNDPLYGPVMVVGAGGILVELVRDIALALLPVRRRDVATMLDKLKVAKLLRGYRGRPACDMAALAQAICGLSDFFLDHRHAIADIEINPLVVLETGVCAVDVRAIPCSIP